MSKRNIKACCETCKYYSTYPLQEKSGFCRRDNREEIKENVRVYDDVCLHYEIRHTLLQREIAKELKEVPPTVAEAYVSWDIEELTKRQIVKKYKNYHKKENE